MKRLGLIILVLPLLVGCNDGGEALKPLWIEKDFSSKAEAISALNAIDRHCFLPVDVLDDDNLILQHTKYVGHERPGTARFGGPSIGDVSWGYRVLVNPKTYFCLKITWPWNSWTPEDAALYQAWHEKVKGRFDRAHPWQTLLVDLTIPIIIKR